jgi:2-C-methyl-D-erythritol 4-phosphate cytidylyltransferase
MTRANATTSCGVVIAAAGGGKRFGTNGGRKKQFIELAGRPLLFWSLDVFSSIDGVQRIIVVSPKDDVARVEEIVRDWTKPRGASSVSLTIEVVPGGERRQDSVRIGLERFWDDLDIALVHDAARPLIRVEDARRVVDAVREHGAAVIGYPATDSIKWEKDGLADRDLDRRRVWQVQTPQGASCEHLRAAYTALTDDEDKTDEVALLEGIGVQARLVEGSRDNLKVTMPGDDEVAELMLRRR